MDILGNIKKVVISKGIEVINNFSIMSPALTEVEIPSTVKYIKQSAFVCCDNLGTIYYTGSLEEWKMIDIDSSNDYYLTEDKVQPNYK